MKHSEKLFEWGLMSLIGLFLCLPLPLTIYSRQPDPPAWLKWLRERNLTLMGVETTRPPVAFSLPNVLNGGYQRERAAGFDREFIPRGAMIRLTCELHFRLFRTSALRSATISVGRADWLYVTNYLREYCLLRPPRSQMVSLVNDLQALHRQCRNRGIALALVVTPSKASVYPEQFPPAWRSRYDARPRSYDHLAELLPSSGIPYVDGHALTMAAKNDSPAPVFPKGGIHWGAYAAWLASSALVETLRQQGKPLSPLRYEGRRVRDVPMDTITGRDADVYNLMNLTWPWRYPVAEMTIQRVPAKEDAKLTAAFVGGSFSDSILEQLSASGQFAEINFYGYYKQAKWTFSSGIRRLAALPVTSIDVEREIFGADCLILELNEASMHFPKHLNMFLADTRSLEGRPSEPKPRFRYETYKEYELGTDIWLKTESAAAITPYLTGFFPPEPTGTWTDGNEATARLVVAPPGTDLVLDADVLSFGDTEQYAEVFANETLVEKWRFPTIPAGRQKAVIPKEAIGSSGRLVLRFVIPKPRSLRQIGAAPDDRPIGVAFSRIRISAAEDK
jgi:hypothetical protein